MDTLFLLGLLQVKHYYADFMIQSYEQTVKKGIYANPIGMSHSVDHLWCTLTALLVFSLVYPIGAATILICGLVEAVLHYHIDYVKMHFGTKNMQTSLFWNQFGLDQLAHQLTYLGMAYYINILL